MKYPVLGFISCAGFLAHLYLAVQAFTAYLDAGKDKDGMFGGIAVKFLEMRLESLITTTIVFLLLTALFFGLKKKT
jgi:hypothetical protein